MSIKELALGYARDGIHIFPCREKPEEIVTDHGEIKSFETKTPYTQHGLHQATTRDRIIEKWWDMWPGAMIGAPTGERSGFWVLDIDVPGEGDKAHKHDGRIWLEEMERLHGELPATRIAKTGGGGLHILFKHVPGVGNGSGVKSGLGDGVDVRGEGGFVVMPGSELATGAVYEWFNDEEIAYAPQWLIDIVRKKDEQSRPLRNEAISAGGGKNERYSRAALEKEVDDFRNTPTERGAALNRVAFSLGTLVGAGELTESEVAQELYAAAYDNGLVATDGERSVRRAIDRGIRAGAGRPREVPQPTGSDYSHRPVRMRDLSRMIERGLERAESDEEPEYDERREDDEPDEDEELPVKATPFMWTDPKTIPLRQFVYGKHYIRKYVSVTVSPGGLGKTSNSICEGMAMASGFNLMGIEPRERLNVWIFNAEDPMEELTRRAMACATYFGLEPRDFEGRLFIDSGREQELVVMHEDKKAGIKINVPIVESVVEQIKRKGIDVMIVDPFVSTHGVNENDNGAIDKVAKLWAQIADYTNCSIDIVHHLKKVSDREATVEDARGAVSLIGAARSVRVFNRMTSEQAAAANIEENDRHGYFYITNGKNNLAPLTSKADWRHLVGQSLENGDSKNEPDFAPVVTEWKYPTQADRAPDFTKQQLDEVRGIIGGDRGTSANEKAKTWFGNELAKVIGVSRDHPARITKLRDAIAALKRQGFIIEADKADEHGELHTVWTLRA
ncbi:putative DNA primase protein [Rhizobium phage RHph_X2_26]|nr:putative DNA primase protein [Rhizobium phage RHph_X2_26]